VVGLVIEDLAQVGGAFFQNLVRGVHVVVPQLGEQSADAAEYGDEQDAEEDGAHLAVGDGHDHAARPDDGAEHDE